MTTYTKPGRWDDAIESFWAMLAVIAIGLAWLTSVVNCIITGKWILLIVDLFFAPVAVIHGFMVWIGVG